MGKAKSLGIATDSAVYFSDRLVLSPWKSPQDRNQLEAAYRTRRGLSDGQPDTLFRTQNRKDP